MEESTTYKIVLDEKALKDFIEWLPDLENNEKYYVSLFARKKYSDKIKTNDKTQLKRFVSNKERLFEKIKQLECPIGAYTLKEMDAPPESLVLYINPNPRCMKNATFQMVKKSIDLIQCDGQNYNLHAEAMSCIQRSKSKSHFCDFDIDETSVDLTKMFDILPKEDYNVLQTRGGYHILVNTRTASKKIKWHQMIRNAYNVDQIGDQLIPVPGCTQGGWIPKLMKSAL